MGVLSDNCGHGVNGRLNWHLGVWYGGPWGSTWRSTPCSKPSTPSRVIAFFARIVQIYALLQPSPASRHLNQYFQNLYWEQFL